MVFVRVSDIDECTTDSNICSNGRCENFMGGYQCICHEGYESNDLKTTCIGKQTLHEMFCVTCVASPGYFVA